MLPIVHFILSFVYLFFLLIFLFLFKSNLATIFALHFRTLSIFLDCQFSYCSLLALFLHWLLSPLWPNPTWPSLMCNR
ncbi:hypothetical protein F383_29725 [Gossypium arboreum]|uniref:Uncharacterized protein n=1 Tax=Gossypium arboreum TaxID=29729 RepID=A0A0B0MVV4_GOSAR|nr:hypothetical protein F383_29725 [Gossypium arboreum]